MLATFHAPHAAPMIAVIPQHSGPRATIHKRAYNGNGHEIFLQGFHWESHAGAMDPASGQRKSWYRIVQENAGAIRGAGFSWVWFPPASDSLSPQGYLPRRWHSLDTSYGSAEELRQAIRALGPVRAMADVVLNHRVGVATGGADFAEPAFPDNRAAVTANDSSGVGLGRPSTGEPFHAGRNLDHTNPDVQAAVREYLRRLRALGFAGWRYDLVKGYHGRFIGDYNDATAPLFSVGELFENDARIVAGWIASTGGRSTAFDFPTRHLLYEAIQGNDYTRLAAVRHGRLVPGGLIGRLPSRAVTFLDNHDTEFRRDQENQYANSSTRHFPGATVAMGYAYVLTHPGVPCVFWPHFFDWGQSTRQRLERFLSIRREMGIHARSTIRIREAGRGLYAAVIGERLAVKLGPRDWCPGWGWRREVEGEGFAVWTRKGK